MRTSHIINIIGILFFLTWGRVLADEQISDYIRKCCIIGLRNARTTNECEKMESAVANISRLWIGLCSSTIGVCCSRELDRQHCELGRLAALEGTSCDNGSSTTYKNCCRACQVGLAVKASQQKCRDPLFSFLSNIDSYRICCSEDGFANQSDEKENTLDIDAHHAEPEEEDAKPDDEDQDGTIVLADDDDICGKIPNLCAHICENTFDAYKCSCNPGYTLDDNNVTCSENKDHLCPGGYILDAKQGKCVDIDECKEQLHECKSTQYCHNTIGGYHCLNVKAKSCPPGYLYNIKSEECEDEDECIQSPCEKGYKCSNYRGGYDCNPVDSQACGTGFYLNEGSCADIDECNYNATNSCKTEMHQECKNTVGSYHCDCLPGYSLDVTQNECVDINECSINNHNCLSTQRCDNTIGSYICTRWTSCGTGYTLNAETGNCDDDDECALNTHNCPLNYDCYNTKGSFRCHRKTTTTTSTTTTTTTPLPATSTTPAPGRDMNPQFVSQQAYNRLDYAPSYLTNYGSIAQRPCTSGFHRNSLGACVDINECIEYKPCMNHERCINTNGSYRCESLIQCPAGLRSTSDGTSCVDINECETGDHNCGEKQICRNRHGGYICACPPGHQVTRLPDGVNSCEDINECAQDQPVCSSNAHCFNTIGSYYCECKSGFQKKPLNGPDQDNWQTHSQCFDVDECQSIPGLCQQKCVNFWGGYRCTCNSGYELSQDNRTCNDIDECEVHKDYKLCMGYCINTAGSYQCSCPRGYTLAADKNTCRDIDECETKSENHVCTGRNDICTNIRGSFKCTTINCPNGYINDQDQKNRCRQTNNFCEGDECYTKPSAYTYNFITFVSKLMIPPDGRTIFTLRGPIWYDDIDFDLNVVRVQAAPNVERASEIYFDTLKSNNQVNLILKKALEGPQDVELDLSMTVFTNGMPRGKSVAKLFLFVSQYTY
ncbi:fibulin-1 [Drosophila novamexicana]|uniref:fibulin-1 n=1 Tax=Drosophila novamexicana TaxID=47314 RepID=UPI0011E5B6CB|nr:fibulin-1 [Drosophila novamexicana]